MGEDSHRGHAAHSYHVQCPEEASLHTEEASLHRASVVVSGGWRRGVSGCWWVEIFLLKCGRIKEVDNCNGCRLGGVNYLHDNTEKPKYSAAG